MRSVILSFMAYDPSSALTNAQKASVFAQLFSWLAVFMIMNALEFMCLSVAKLMVLDRMAGFAVPKADGTSRRWVVVGGRIVMAAVVAGNVVGLCGNIAAAAQFVQTAGYFSAASAAFTGNNTDDGNKFNNLGNEWEQRAIRTQSVQQFCEVAVLLLIIVAFAVIGALCARRIRAALKSIPKAIESRSVLMMETSSAAAAAGRHLQRQVVGTAAFVFVTFLLRAVYSTMSALANGLQNEGVECRTDACSSCYNLYRLMQLWLIYTPEFQLMIVLISSPLSLLVALWGMTSDRMLRQMQSNPQQMGTMKK